MWNKKILPLVWRLDGFRQPNDGICPWCDHGHGPRFGRFICENCDGYVADDDLSRNLLGMSVRQTYLAVLGGVILAVVMVILGLSVDWVIDAFTANAI